MADDHHQNRQRTPSVSTPGDEMTYHRFALTLSRAKFEHHCVWCCQPILTHSYYLREQSVYDRQFQNFNWHEACHNDAEARWKDGADEEFVSGNDMPFHALFQIELSAYTDEDGSRLGSCCACEQPFPQKGKRRRCPLCLHAYRAKWKADHHSRPLADVSLHLERLFELCMPEPNSGCWIWMGPKGSSSGYGSFTYANRNERSHRASYLLHKGEIPDGMWVLHKCDNPSCVNPDHLFLGNAQDNSTDMSVKGRSGAAKLSPELVKEIRTKALEPGATYRGLGRQYGVTDVTIRNAVMGKNYAHVR